MKIAIFTDNFYPELSGVSDSVIALAQELAKSGNSVAFFVPKYSKRDYLSVGKKYEKLNLGELIKIYRFSSFHFSGATGQARMVIPSFWRWLSVMRFRPDIIHTQQIYGVGIEALIASRILNVPIVGTNHTALKHFVRYSPIRSKMFVKMALKYESWYYNRCRYVSAPSNSVFEEMAKYGFNRPHEVVSNPVDLMEFSPLAKIVKEKESVVYAGRLAPEKNVDVLIKAVAEAKKEIPGIKLYIAGHGTSESQLKKLVGSLGLSESVKFLGTLNKNELAARYRQSNIFVIASTSETQSMTLIQAMGCGLPAIGAKALALPEYIGSDVGYIVEAGNAGEFADKIVYLLKNDEKRIKMGNNANMFVRQFSAENIAKKWLQIYKKNME